MSIRSDDTDLNSFLIFHFNMSYYVLCPYPMSLEDLYYKRIDRKQTTLITQLHSYKEEEEEKKNKKLLPIHTITEMCTGSMI